MNKFSSLYTFIILIKENVNDNEKRLNECFSRRILYR